MSWVWIIYSHTIHFNQVGIIVMHWICTHTIQVHVNAFNCKYQVLDFKVCWEIEAKCINHYRDINSSQLTPRFSLFDGNETLRPCTWRFVPCHLTLFGKSSNNTVLPIWIIAHSLILCISTPFAPSSIFNVICFFF